VALLLVAAVAYYTLVIGARALDLLRDGRWAFRGLGVGLLLLDVVGVAVVTAEVRFGVATSRLAKRAGEVDDDFDNAAAAVEATPEDWRAWYRLAMAYDAGRDPRRGRAAMRKALALSRLERVEQPR
jgi:hypothetical protein